MSIFQILPTKIASACQKICDLCEIRLRKNCEVIVATRYKKMILTENGQTLRVSEEEIMDVLLKCCNHSIYTVNEQLKQGFLTYQGMRIGVVGEAVYEKGKLLTIKNFSSLSIRIASQIDTYDPKVHNFLFSNGLKNVLVFSKVGIGKTTLIRCMAKKLTYQKELYNILVIDERNEICGYNQFDLGRSDVYFGIDKRSGIEYGIKTLSPDMIVCDELKVFEDIQAISEGVNCGVNFLATIHAQNVEDLKNKEFFKKALYDKIFDFFVELSDREGKGTIERIYNHELSVVY